MCRFDNPLPDTLTGKMEKAGEKKRSLVLPSRSFHKAGYLVDTHPKDQQQWITRQRAVSTSEWLVMIKSGPPSIVYRLL